MKIIKCVFVVLILLMGAVLVFYFWASSGIIADKENRQLLSYNEVAPTSDTITIMTFNLGYLSGMTNNLPVEMPVQLFDDNLEKARVLIQKLQPDIIGFQEIDFGSSRSWKRNQLDSLSSGYHHAYKSVNWDKRYVPFPYWPVKYHFGKMLSGQAILSKYPLSNEETVVLEKPLNAPFYYNKFYLDRLVQMVDIQIGSRIVKVMNLHLEAFDSETRENQALVVSDLYDGYASHMPVLLIGDFNSFPYWEEGADETMKTIFNNSEVTSAISREAYDSNKTGHITSSSGQPNQMIDYILYNQEFIRPIESRVIQEAGEISDHFPVLMKFTFTSKNDSLISE